VLLHCCYSVATVWSKYSYSVVTVLLQGCYRIPTRPAKFHSRLRMMVKPVLQRCHSVGTGVSQDCHKNVHLVTNRIPTRPAKFQSRLKIRGVAVLLHCCNIVVTVLSQCCHSVVTVLLQCCYSVVTVLSQECYRIPTRPAKFHSRLKMMVEPNPQAP
jgi:hypothetical protein